MLESNSTETITKYKPGIFQYCDRWCEKCNHTNECLYYDVNKKFFLSGDKKFNFWDRIEDIVNLTIDDLEQVSESMGVDLKCFSERFPKNKSDETLSNGYILYEKTESYSKNVNDWFDSFAKEPLNVSTDNLDNKISAKELAKSMRQLTKAIEYIRWYQDLISNKLKNALNSKHKFQDGFHKGFAKVALIAIDRSIDSWKSISENLHGMSDKVSSQILLLEKIREEVEKEFPHARTYNRVGLDA